MADTTGEQGASGEQPPAGPTDDVKARFREALRRKQAHGGTDVSDHGDRSKVHDAHGPARPQQLFRRKSGS